MIKAICAITRGINFYGSPGLKIPARENPVLKYPKNTRCDIFVKSPNSTSVLKKNDISFGYNFSLKEPSGIPCAYCGKPVISKSDIYGLKKLKGKELAEKLDSFAVQNYDAMPEIRNKALRLLKIIVLDNPDKNAEEILPVAYIRARNRMIIKQSVVYSRVEKLAKRLNSKELENYINKVKEQDVCLKPNVGVDELANFLANDIHVEFRKDVIRKIEEFANKDTNGNRDLWERVQNHIQNLPSSKNDPDAFLVKFISKAIRKDPKIENELIPLSDASSALFYSTLFFPLASSAEHIKPFSDNGKSHFSNYLVTHANCNSDRGNIPWVDFMLEEPKRFDCVINNLRTINSYPEFSKIIPSYIGQVSMRLAAECKAKKDIPEVANFLSELEKISENAKCVLAEQRIKENALLCIYSSIYGSDELKAVYSILAPVLLEKDEIKQGEIAENLIQTLFDNVRETRNKRYTYYIQNTLSTPEGLKFKRYLAGLRNSDPILSMKGVKIPILKRIFSEEEMYKYKNKIIKELKNLFPMGFKDKHLETLAAKLPSKLLPPKKPSGIALKLLLETRLDTNYYDIDRLNSWFEKPAEKNSNFKKYIASMQGNLG